MARRRVPLRLWGAVMFGHLLMTIGWLWVAIALGAMLDRSDVSWHHNLDARATGVVERLVAKSGAGKTNKTYYEVYYRFSDELGRTYQGMAMDMRSHPPQIGEPVAVEYETRDPSFSQLAAHLSPLYTPLYLLAVLACTLPGLAVVVGMAIRAHRRLRVLRIGEQTTATIVDKSTEGSGQNAMTFVAFEYASGDERYKRTVQVDNPERFAVGGTEPVLVDAARPHEAILLDDLPARVELREGELVAAMPPLSALATLGLVGFVAYKVVELLAMSI